MQWFLVWWSRLDGRGEVVLKEGERRRDREVIAGQDGASGIDHWSCLSQHLGILQQDCSYQDQVGHNRCEQGALHSGQIPHAASQLSRSPPICKRRLSTGSGSLSNPTAPAFVSFCSVLQRLHDSVTSYINNQLGLASPEAPWRSLREELP